MYGMLNCAPTANSSIRNWKSKSPEIATTLRSGSAAQMLHVFKDRHWINCGQAGPLGWTIPAALGVCAADPERNVVAISGDFDFQFLIEEL
ncbi:thiamine pyrophosphate-dependent enzyme, partial [Escherichia coli]|uniref:thiamine pyrophosphate-dependent enzyme n=1 Tax=Escherichia coli TaxID=562 RepID=UPI003D80AD19